MKSFEKLSSEQYLERIREYIESSTGLDFEVSNSDLKITQAVDSKSLSVDLRETTDVIMRWDADGKRFLQINFDEGKKILLTDKLIGFKPKRIVGLDMEKLPNVVTTSDLLSILEAIEESLLEGLSMRELEILKNVYEAVLKGGESVGFDLTTEKAWVSQIARHQSKASA